MTLVCLKRYALAGMMAVTTLLQSAGCWDQSHCFPCLLLLLVCELYSMQTDHDCCMDAFACQGVNVASRVTNNNQVIIICCPQALPSKP